MRSLSEIMLSVFSPHSSAASHLLDPRNRPPTALFKGSQLSFSRLGVTIANPDALRIPKKGSGPSSKSAIPC